MIDTISAFDTTVLHTLYAMRDPIAVLAFIWVSELGRAFTVYALASCAAIVLAYRRAYALAAGLAISVCVAGIAILLLKGLIERPRPPLAYEAYHEIWWSFPSAHAALAVALYGYIAHLAFMRGTRPVKIFTTLAAAPLIGAVGFSRLYLGVHYMSDVVAGYVLGALCLWLGIAISRMLKLP